MLDDEGRELRDDLVAFMDDGAPDAFDPLAARVFAYNYSHVPAYAAYCRARDVTPESVVRETDGWTRIPAVPTAAFKELTLLARGATAEAVFRTSGTTRGASDRGEHHVADLGLYRDSLRRAFRRFLLPDDPTLTFLSLMPPASALPDSSLAFMISDVMAAFSARGSATFADADGTDFAGLDRAVERLSDAGTPALLLGTSASFIHWLDRLRRDGRRHRLPDGSRLMDTGGFKGRGRAVSPDELREAYSGWLGLPPERCINEYGMTEMLSQMYDDSLLADPTPVRRKRGPAWVRTTAVDPATLRPLPPGAPGVLRHLDLANIGSVAAIQTEDFGRVEDGRIVLEGRAVDAPPRGCSLAMDEILNAAGRR